MSRRLDLKPVVYTYKSSHGERKWLTVRSTGNLHAEWKESWETPRGSALRVFPDPFDQHIDRLDEVAGVYVADLTKEQARTVHAHHKKLLAFRTRRSKRGVVKAYKALLTRRALTRWIIGVTALVTMAFLWIRKKSSASETKKYTLPQAQPPKQPRATQNTKEKPKKVFYSFPPHQYYWVTKEQVQQVQNMKSDHHDSSVLAHLYRPAVESANLLLTTWNDIYPKEEQIEFLKLFKILIKRLPRTRFNNSDKFLVKAFNSFRQANTTLYTSLTFTGRLNSMNEMFQKGVLLQKNGPMSEKEYEESKNATIKFLEKLITVLDKKDEKEAVDRQEKLVKFGLENYKKIKPMLNKDYLRITCFHYMLMLFAYTGEDNISGNSYLINISPLGQHSMLEVRPDEKNSFQNAVHSIGTLFTTLFQFALEAKDFDKFRTIFSLIARASEPVHLKLYIESSEMHTFNQHLQSLLSDLVVINRKQGGENKKIQAMSEIYDKFVYPIIKNNLNFSLIGNSSNMTIDKKILEIRDLWYEVKRSVKGNTYFMEDLRSDADESSLTYSPYYSLSDGKGSLRFVGKTLFTTKYKDPNRAKVYPWRIKKISSGGGKYELFYEGIKVYSDNSILNLESKGKEVLIEQKSENKTQKFKISDTDYVNVEKYEEKKEENSKVVTSETSDDENKEKSSESKHSETKEAITVKEKEILSAEKNKDKTKEQVATIVASESSASGQDKDEKERKDSVTNLKDKAKPCAELVLDTMFHSEVNKKKCEEGGCSYNKYITGYYCEKKKEN
jgi:hypothetical protein